MLHGFNSRAAKLFLKKEVDKVYKRLYAKALAVQTATKTERKINMILTKQHAIEILNGIYNHLENEGLLYSKPKYEWEIGYAEFDLVRQWVENSPLDKMAAFDHSDCADDCEIINPDGWMKEWRKKHQPVELNELQDQIDKLKM